MNRSLLKVLRCPRCYGTLNLSCDREDVDGVRDGTLKCRECLRGFAIIDGVPRFVPAENYAESFGFQWAQFPRTQLDSCTGLPISRTRFLDETGWTAEKLSGKLVLDAGCGSGRFAEVALSLGAEVVAIDYSSAVEAAWQNLAPCTRFHAVQANLYELPFAPASFDFVYSLGVLQHTPDPRRALIALTAMVRPGGRIVVDFYLRSFRHLLHPKYVLRPLTKRLPRHRLFSVVRTLTPTLLAISDLAGRLPLVGRVVKKFVPVANYRGVYPLSERAIREWAVLDTFDWLSPRYDQPQSGATLRHWLDAAGLTDVEVFCSHHLTGRATRPSA